MASTRDAKLGEALERLHAASVELSFPRDVSEIAETALAWALELTRSSVGFVSLRGDSDAADRVYALSAGGQRFLPPREVDRLIHAGSGDSALVHVLRSSGRELGVAGVTADGAYTEIQRSCFSIFATQLAAAFAAAMPEPSQATKTLRAQLETRTEELGRLVERLRTVDAARQLLLRNLVTAQDNAARRFAGELHDDALQTLTAASLHTQRLAQAGSADRAALAETQALLTRLEESLRRLLFEVRPPTLENLGGLEATIRERMMMLKALTDAEVTLEVELPEELTYELKSMVFRQVAEALTNVEKHARATRVKLSLRLIEGAIQGVVVDNGQGFKVDERNNLPGHLGLLSLRERAILAGGWYKIESEPGAGTRIEFGLPTS